MNLPKSRFPNREAAFSYIVFAVTAYHLSGSNVLRFEMADGTSVIVRPSGTEPKIKVYILTQGKDAADAKANVDKYGEWVKSLQK